MSEEEVIEKLSDIEHDRWCSWQRYLHSCCIKNQDGSLTIPKVLVERWKYEINARYKDLPYNIQESDRKETYKIIPLIDEYLQHQLEIKEQEIRLDQTKKVFEVLADAIKNGSISYRNLIYDKLGFTGHYGELMAGLTITNAIVDLEEKDKVIDEIKAYINSQMNPYEDDGDFGVDCCCDGFKLLEILESGKNGK